MNVLRRWAAECPDCGGKGSRLYLPSGDVETCSTCGGEGDVEVVPFAIHRGAVARFERVGKLASWIERDRRESDKVLMYAQELAQLAEGYGGR